MPQAESKHGGARVRFPPPLVFLFLLVAGFLLEWRVPLPDLSLPKVARIAAGTVLAFGGFSLLMWAATLFRRSGQDPEPWLPTPSLVFSGPYRFTRNPMYVGMTVVAVGIGIAADALWVVLLAPVALLVVHFIAVRPEEAYLAERFGEDYLRFKRAVRRYL